MSIEIALGLVGLVVLALVAWIGWDWWQWRRVLADIDRTIDAIERQIAALRCPGCECCGEDDDG